MDDTNVSFFTFLSQNLGTGSPGLDAAFLLGIGITVALLLQTMQRTGQGIEVTETEVELLNNISALLSTMNIQIAEMRTTILHEFDRFNAELSFFKQELLDLQKVADEHSRVQEQAEYNHKPVAEDLHGLFAVTSTYKGEK